MASFVSMKVFLELQTLVYELQAQVQALETHLAPEAAGEPEPIPSIDEATLLSITSLADVLPADTVAKLDTAGYQDIASVSAASDSDLTDITGIGQATVDSIREALS